MTISRIILRRRASRASARVVGIRKIGIKSQTVVTHSRASLFVKALTCNQLRNLPFEGELMEVLYFLNQDLHDLRISRMNFNNI